MKVISILAFLGLIVLAVMKMKGLDENAENYAEDIIVLILLFILTAIVGGFLFITYVLPRFGDAVGEAMMSSGEEAGTDPYLKARGKAAIGDYEGAVQEYQHILAENPEDRMPVAEITKLYLERLHDPANAELTLENAIRQDHWSDDDAAFFIFRLIDIIQEHQPDDQDRVVNLLQKVIRRYPGTRYSANATHKLREIDPALVTKVLAEVEAGETEEEEHMPAPDLQPHAPDIPHPLEADDDTGIPEPSSPPPPAEPPKPTEPPKP